MQNINNVRPKFTRPSEQGTTVTVTEKVNSTSIYTIEALDDEFYGSLNLEIARPEQNQPFYVHKTEESNGTAAWQLGVRGRSYIIHISNISYIQIVLYIVCSYILQ